MPAATTHIRKIDQQGERKCKIEQYVNTESQILKGMCVFPVQFPDTKDESSNQKNQVSLPVTGIIMQETGRKQKASANNAHGPVDPDADDLGHVGKLQDSDDIDDKKESEKTKGMYKNTSC